MTTTDTRVAPWPGLPDPCPTWCAGGHRVGDFPEDRRHQSELLPVPVTSHRPLVDNAHAETGQPAELLICLRQRPDARHATLELLDEDADPRFVLPVTSHDW